MYPPEKEKKIRERAYFIYLWRLRWTYRDDPVRNWLMAEEEIKDAEERRVSVREL